MAFYRSKRLWDPERLKDKKSPSNEELEAQEEERQQQAKEYKDRRRQSKVISSVIAVVVIFLGLYLLMYVLTTPGYFIKPFKQAPRYNVERVVKNSSPRKETKTNPYYQEPEAVGGKESDIKKSKGHRYQTY